MTDGKGSKVTSKECASTLVTVPSEALLPSFTSFTAAIAGIM